MAYNKPYPNIDADIRPFWEACQEHQLKLYRCQKCGAWYWPVAFCRNHPNEPLLGEMAWEKASGRGKVFSFNIHHWAFRPGFKDDIPYVYALVELEEGPIIGSNIIGCPPGDVKIGMPVEVVFEDHEAEGFTLPKFKPV